MKKLEDYDLKELIQNAKDAGACDDIYLFDGCSSVKDVLEKADIDDIDVVFYAYWYAKEVIKGRWPEAEEIIMNDALYSYRYARNVMKARWPEAEEVILITPHIAYCYARDVIKGRWAEAEKIILGDVEYSYLYTKYVVKGRWPEAEETILGNLHCRKRYLNSFPEADK